MIINNANIRKLENIAAVLKADGLPSQATLLTTLIEDRNNLVCLFEALGQLNDVELANVAALVAQEQKARA